MSKHKKIIFIILFALLIVVVLFSVYFFASGEFIYNKSEDKKNKEESGQIEEAERNGTDTDVTAGTSTPESEEDQLEEEQSDDEFMYGGSVEKTRDQGLDPGRDDDGDGLLNYQEVEVFGTDPLKKDTDGDGVDDKKEIEAGTDPTDPDSF